MRHILMCVLVSTIALAGCAGPNHTQPKGEPIFISRQVEAHLKSYLRMVGAGREGAFAVSEKGTIGFFTYCSSSECRGQANFANEAVQHCEGFGQGHCVVLAVNSDIRRPYKLIGDEQASLPQ
jgi:hypothetical protein